MEDSLQPLIVNTACGAPEYAENISKLDRKLTDLEIVAVFVVSFDARAGNTLEWCKPEYVRHPGLEFKAIPNGAHSLDKDFVFLFNDGLYGCACYQKLAVSADGGERGARMKSAGILARSHMLLSFHQEQLRSLVQYVLARPNDYSLLEQYYAKWSGNLMNVESFSAAEIGISSTVIQQFLSHFSSLLMMLWKSILLKKRVLLCFSPPAGQMCLWVHCLALLRPPVENETAPACQPLFYVSIADISTLASQESYVACTTDRILETKTHLYDVCISDHNKLTIPSEQFETIVKSTEGDKLRVMQLEYLIRSCFDDDCPHTAEDAFASYFSSLNRSLLGLLMRRALSDERTVTLHELQAIGVDLSDMTFLEVLVDSEGIDVNLPRRVCC